MTSCTSLRRSETIASGVVRKVITWASMSATVLNNTADNCCVLPTTTVPILSEPGLTRAAERKSSSL